MAELIVPDLKAEQDDDDECKVRLRLVEVVCGWRHLSLSACLDHAILPTHFPLRSGLTFEEKNHFL